MATHDLRPDTPMAASTGDDYFNKTTFNEGRHSDHTFPDHLRVTPGYPAVKFLVPRDPVLFNCSSPRPPSPQGRSHPFVISNGLTSNLSLPAYLIKNARGLDILMILREARLYEKMGYTPVDPKTLECVDLSKEKCAEKRCRCHECVVEGINGGRDEHMRESCQGQFRWEPVVWRDREEGGGKSVVDLVES